MTQHRTINLHLVSDSTGETLNSMARATLARFDDPHVVHHRWSLIRSRLQLDRVLDGIEAEPGLVLFTVADRSLRHALEEHCSRLGVGCHSVLDPVMDLLQAELGERWFDKPPDLAAARAQLLALRGRSHRLVTATVAWRGGARIWQNVTQPRLAMRDFSDAFLDAYLASEGEALLGSVGAYRLEALGLHLFSRVEGEHSAILGLPMLPLLGFLRQHGVVIG